MKTAGQAWEKRGGLPWRGLACRGLASRGLARWLIAVSAMLLLFWQGVVVQTHVHPARAAASPAGSGGHVRAGVDARHAPAGDPADCPLCRELARAGQLLSPAAPLFLFWCGAIVCLFLLPFIAWARQDRSHAWLGRGPPHIR